MATPTNKTSLTSSTPISSEVVVWEGPNIPCLELCTGETVSGVVAKVGIQVCNIITDLDELKNLSYACVINKLGYNGDLVDPTKFSLKALFQLLLDNDCKLKGFIDAIVPTNTETTVDLTGLDLSCITPEIINLCGQIPDQLEVLKVIQAIINILCGIQDDVADLLIRIITIETQISSLGDPGQGGYVEPLITSCLSNTPTLLSVHVPTLTDKAICDLNNLVGTQSQVNDVLARQCLGDYIGNGSINQTASNLAQAAANKEVIICDLLARVKSIEGTCCSQGCGDIRIGFLQSYIEATNTYTIDFTYGAGTDIPAIFVDCGSTFIITDWKGNTKTQVNAPNTLVNGATFQLSFVGSGLDVSRPMNIQIKTCFTNTLSGIICKDCFGGSLDESAVAITPTCWDFAIPKTDALGCPGKTINHVPSGSSVPSLITTQGNYFSGGGNTSIPDNQNVQHLVLPVFDTPNSVLNNIICNNNKIMLSLQGQSTVTPPEINLVIVGTSPSLYINIVGTLNATCTC